MSAGRSFPPLLALSLLATSVAAAGDVPAPQPARAGLDPARLGKLRAQLQAFVDGKQIAGAVALVGRRGHIGSVEVVGFRDLGTQTPMTADTVFRIASMTKMATAVAVMMLEDEGKLAVDDPVEKHLPEFRGQRMVASRNGDTVTFASPPRPITIKDLLTHTSGIRCDMPAGFADVGRKRDRSIAEVTIAHSQQPLEGPAGKVWKYCGAGFDILGRLVEVAAGKPYEAFLDERLFRPLGMKDTTFYPDADHLARQATLYKKEGEGLVPVERPPPATRETSRYVQAGGGLYSTAADQARLYQMLLDKGTAGGRRYLRPETVARMTKVYFSEGKTGFTPGLGMGLGLQVVMTPTEVTEKLSPGAFGHGGAYGTQGWIDPRKQMFFVLMIQRQGFGNGDASDVRKAFQAAAVAALK
jgi:CubicO group peptidase (beta-lactamase class C family)